MNVRRWAIVILVGAILSVAALHASRAMLAGGDVLAAKKFARMGWSGRLPAIEAWTTTRERLDRALALEPDNPVALELMGVLSMQRLDDPAILREATSHYVRSLELRPVSPVTWANLAEARYQVGDISRMFETALQNAARLGPSEPQAQRVVSLYGLAVFDEVEPPTRKAIEAMVGAGMRRDPGEMLAIAHRRGRLDVACRYLPETKRKVEPGWVKLCAEVAAKRTR